MILPDVCPQAVLPVVSRVTEKTKPHFELRVLWVDMSPQPLFVVECFVTVITLVVPQVLMDDPHMSIQYLDRLIHCSTEVTHTLLVLPRVLALVVQHEGLVIETFSTELTSEANRGVSCSSLTCFSSVQDVTSIAQ